jgi:hypothetical protein
LNNIFSVSLLQASEGGARMARFEFDDEDEWDDEENEEDEE